MLKFNDKGQGFWDFILENCSEEFISAVEKDLKGEFSIGILEVKEFLNGDVVVYLDCFGYFVIHVEYAQSLCEGGERKPILREQLSKASIRDLQKMGVI